MSIIWISHDLAVVAGIADRVIVMYGGTIVEEAQIEGQLQHPGIVPVYELGVGRDGRPFFAMKLVRGKTLAALFAGIMTKLGVYALLRVMPFVALDPLLPEILVWAGGLSALLGVLGALGQYEMRRLLAFHSVSQVGYLVVALGLGSVVGLAAAIFFALHHSLVSVQPATPDPGDTLTYTIRLENPGPTLPSVQVTSTLPAEVTYLGNLWASSGSYGEAAGVITWTGAVMGGAPITITYGATLDGGLTDPTAIVNPVLLDDGVGNVWAKPAVAIVHAIPVYLPLMLRE